MRYFAPLVLLLGAAGCASPAVLRDGRGPAPTVAAEALIDAFYSFDSQQLRAAMADAPASQPQLLFYQGWAEGGNYAVLDRQPCTHFNAGEVRCDITVRDDLIEALGTGYWVTDTFHMSIENGRIAAVRTSSNDPPEFSLAMEWTKQQRPEVMTGPCQGFFAGGPSPQACVRAMVQGFTEYRAAMMAD